MRVLLGARAWARVRWESTIQERMQGAHELLSLDAELVEQPMA